MASIRKRIAKGCVTESVQVQIRRAGIPYLCISFVTKEEAIKWVQENEEAYISDPKRYEYLRETENRRESLRKREFKKKEIRDKKYL